MSRKERKSKGTLSILDEFTSETGAGELTYTPKTSDEVMNRIAEATKLADIPLSSRASLNIPSAFPPELDNNQVITVGTNRRQTEDKVETQPRTNVVQSSVKLELNFSQPQAESKQCLKDVKNKNNPLDSREAGVSSALGNQSTIGLQLDHKQTTDQSTIGLQLDHKQTTEEKSNSELVYKRSTKQTTDQSTIGLQLDHKQTTDWHFSSLTGHERNFVIFIFQNCKNSGSLLSSPISNIQLREYLKTRSSSTVKTIIDRVIKKGLISKKPGKTGRGGWMVFEIKKSVFQDLLLGESDYKRSTYSPQTDYIWSTKQTTEQTTNAPYSSSNNLNINTNTIELPANLRRFGISAVNLQTLVSTGKASQEVVERSLAALSFDVENGKSGNLANILFGVLGSGREYISQKYSETLQTELDAELIRIQKSEESQKRLAETKLQIKFKEFLIENPNFLESIRDRNKGFVQTQELLEKVAFEEFKLQGANSEINNSRRD